MFFGNFGTKATRKKCSRTAISRMRFGPCFLVTFQNFRGASYQAVGTVFALRVHFYFYLFFFPLLPPFSSLSSPPSLLPPFYLFNLFNLYKLNSAE